MDKNNLAESLTIETNFLVHYNREPIRAPSIVVAAVHFPLMLIPYLSGAMPCQCISSENYSGALLIYLVFRFTDSNYWSVHSVAVLLILTFPLLLLSLSLVITRRYSSFLTSTQHQSQLTVRVHR